jgi:TatD DNase family protein
VEIAQAEPNLFATVGIHPCDWNGTQLGLIPTMTKIAELAAQKKVVAIGETGLDYFHLEQKEDRARAIARQQDAFHRHIQLAQKLDLILIIHVRDKEEQAYWDTLRILEEEDFTGRFILHCASGPLAYIQKAVGMGAYFGVAGNVTYKSAEHLRDIVRNVPVNKLLSETDCPFLPPVPYRGQVCEPWMITKTVSFLLEQSIVAPPVFHSNAEQLLKL